MAFSYCSVTLLIPDFTDGTTGSVAALEPVESLCVSHCHLLPACQACGVLNTQQDYQEAGRDGRRKALGQYCSTEKRVPDLSALRTLERTKKIKDDLLLMMCTARVKP